MGFLLTNNAQNESLPDAPLARAIWRIVCVREYCARAFLGLALVGGRNLACSVRSDMSNNTSYYPFRVLLYLLLFSATALAGAALAETEIVYLGKREIRLPAPDGYFRFTGYSKRADQYLESFVGAGNRLLAAFGSEENVAQALQDKVPTLGRYFTAQSFMAAEDVNVDSTQFAELKSAIRTQWSDTSKLERETASLLSQRLQAQIDIKGQYGVFDQTDDSISFAGIAVFTGPDKKPWVAASAATAVKVGDRVYFFSFPIHPIGTSVTVTGCGLA